MAHSQELEIETVIAGGRVVTEKGLIQADVGLRGAKIAAVARRLRGRERVDARGLWILPGAIDGHTHMEAPAFGMTTQDTFESGTRAAAAGGVTTVLDFTLGSGRTTLAEQVQARIAATRRSFVDVGLHAEVVSWRRDRAAEPADATRAGVTSFKFYTVYAERSTPDELADAFRAIAGAGGVAMVHAEDADLVAAASSSFSTKERTRMTSFPRSRPAQSEAAAVEQVCALAEAAGTRLHIAHVSTAGAVLAIARAKSRGARVTAETCPHYLLLDERVYARDDGRQWSVIPPLRTPEDRAALWSALADGTLDTVATDHCPFLTADKAGSVDVLEMPCGLPGVETLLPLVYSEGVAERRLPPGWLARVVAGNPARIFDLAPRKGALEPGADADVVLFDPAHEWTIAAADLHMQTDFSPFEDRRVRGRVARTYVRGRCVFADDEFPAGSGWGRFAASRLDRSS
jgi:dihydropyrimidinase